MKKSKKLILYYIMIFLLILLIGIASFFFTYFYNLINTDLSIEEVSIKETSHINISVKEKNSNIYRHDYNTVVLNNVDKINAYFNYTLTADQEFSGEYSYVIKGYEILGNENRIEREVYKSDINIFEVTGKVINLGYQFDINVKDILDDIKTYKLSNKLDADSVIKFKITINYTLFSETLGKSLIESKDLFVEIPVKDITLIKTSEPINKSVTEYSNILSNDNKLYLVISFEFLGALIMFILVILLLLRKVRKESDTYSVTLDKYLKKYEEIIVHVSTVPELTNTQVLFVDDFKDLVDAASNLNQVINYTEIVKNKAVIFVVMSKDIAYVYKLTR